MGNEMSQLPAPPDELAARVLASSHVLASIRWPHGARSAAVCGTFNDWKQTAMEQSADEPGLWLKELELKTGTHQYKFIIDGQWRHDPSAPTVLDALGNINNYATIKPANGVAHAPQQQRSRGTQQEGTPPGFAAGRGWSAKPSVQSTTVGESSQSGGETSSSGEGLKGSQRINSDPYSLAEVCSVRFSQTVPPKEDLLVQHAASMMLPPHLLLNLPHLAGDGEKAPVHVQLNHLFIVMHAGLMPSASSTSYAPSSLPPSGIAGGDIGKEYKM
ncbi:immunoglobulin E-set [Pavlovales sp. CCMP2436]|nr:immunoglobulin E-set [Pavlovales sp. CCMP2436]